MVSETGREEAKGAKEEEYPKFPGRRELECEIEQLKQQVEQLDALHEIGKLITSALELGEVLIRVVEAAVFITEAEEGTLMLLDEQANELYVRAQKGLGERYAQTLRLRVDDSLAGNVLRTGKSMRLSEESKVVTGYMVNAIMYAPLVCGEQRLGVLSVDNREAERSFSEEDEYLLSVLADYAAIAIENANLLEGLERRARALSGLHIVTQSLLSVHDLQEVLGTIAENAFSVLEADLVVLYEYIKEKDDVRIPPIARGYAKKPDILHRRGGVVPHKESVVFKMLQEDEPFYAPKAREDWARAGFFDSLWVERAASFIGREEIVSSAGIPLLAGGEAVGVLFINYRDFHQFTPDHRERIGIFANQAAIAIQNARLFETEQRHTQELSALYDVALDITKKLEVKPLLNIIVQRAANLLEANGGGLLLRHPKREEIEMVVAHKLLIMRGEKFELGQGLVGRVAQSGKPMIVNDYHAWEDRDRRFDEERYKHLFRVVAGVPLKQENEVIGVLIVSDTDEDRVFEDSDVKLLERFATQAAIAIGNARTVSYLERLVGSSPNAIIAVDRNGHITHFNEASERIIGHKREEVLGKSVVPFYYDGLEEAKKINMLLIEEDEKGRPVSNYETFVRGKDGEKIPIRFSGALLRDAYDKRMGSVGIMTDLREIRLLEERYHALYEVGKVAVEIPESDMRRICQEIMDVVTERVLHLKASYLYLMNEDDELEIMAAGGVAEKYKRPESILKRGEGITSQILDTKRSLYVRNVQKEKKFKYPEWARRNDVRSYLGVPLIVEGEVIGVITVYTGDEYEFSEEEKKFLERFANLAALVIGKAKEVSRSKKIAEILREVMPDVVELSGEGVYGDLWAKVKEIVSRMIPNIALCVYVCDEDKPYIAERKDCNSEALSSRLKPIWHAGETLFIPGVSVDAEACLLLEARSPQERLEGFLVLQKTQTRDGARRRFNNIERLVLTTLAPAVGSALFQQRRWRHVQPGANDAERSG